jgi:predicted nucleic acid-binding protein
MTPRIFMDSSVLFSAANSSKGHSRDLILMSASGEITIVISSFVLQETIRNLSGLSKPPLEHLDQIIQNANIDIVDAAKTAKVNMLVSLDKKHILGRTDLETYINAPIVTPLIAYQKLRTVK